MRRSTKATAYVRAHPGMKTSELVALAKKEGLNVRPQTVQNVRAYDKRKAKANGSPKPTPEARAVVVHRAPKVPQQAGESAVDFAVRALRFSAAEVGYWRAKEELEVWHRQHGSHDQ